MFNVTAVNCNNDVKKWRLIRRFVVWKLISFPSMYSSSFKKCDKMSPGNDVEKRVRQIWLYEPLLQIISIELLYKWSLRKNMENQTIF